MDPIQRLLKTIRGVSKANPVTYIQLSEMIRTLWKTDSSGSDPDTITPTTENTTVNGKHTHKLELPVTQITEIVKTIQSNNHESFLIENTVNESETVESSWTVIPYTEQVGEFKAVVMVRDKSLNTIKTVMNILSFDYSDAIKVINDNAMLLDGSITLACGVDAGTSKLYATVSGMTNNAKRIHLCFERCVVGERFLNLEAEIGMILEATAYMQAYLNMQATANMNLAAQVALTGYSNLRAEIPVILEMSGRLSAYLNLHGDIQSSLEASGLLSSYYNIMGTAAMNLNFQALLKSYMNIGMTMPLSLTAQALLSGGVVVEEGITINDLFPTIISIVNEQMDDTIEGTYIKVQAHDTVNKTITVSWLPPMHSRTLVSPVNADMKWALGISFNTSGWDIARVYVDTTNLATRTINYGSYAAAALEKFIVNANVIIHNPNANEWELNVGAINKKVSSFYSKQCLCVDMFQHSSGSYRMVINGQDSADNSWGNGLFTSADLINWVAISDVATIKTQTAISWFANMQIRITSVIQHPTETGKYFGLFMVLISGKYEVGWIKFDENMANVEYSAAPILSSSATAGGFTSSNIIFFNGKFRLLTNAKYGSAGTWQLEQYISDLPEGPYTFDVNVIDTTSAALHALNTSYRSAYTDEIAPFVIGNKLYAFIGGTAQNELGIPSLQRQWGLIEYNSAANTWFDLRKGLIAGTGFWNEHVGDYPVLFEKNGVFYLYYTATSSTDSYVTTISRKNTNNAIVNLSQTFISKDASYFNIKYTVTCDKLSHDDQIVVITVNGVDHEITIPFHTYSNFITIPIARISTNLIVNSSIKTVPPKYDIGITDLTYTVLAALSENLWTPAIGVWELDNTTGTVAVDKKSGLNGTIYGTPALNQAGKVTNCILFDGVNDYVSIVHNAALNVDAIAASYSVSAWVNSSSPTPISANSRILEKRAASGAYPISWSPLYATDNLLIAIYNNSAAQSITIPKAQVFDGNWHLVVQVIDAVAKTFAVYVDNVLIQSIAITLTGSTANAGNLNIDANGLGGATSACKINQVVVFNKALTANERAVLYNSGAGRPFLEW